jgi:chromosome segregation ATPase
MKTRMALFLCVWIGYLFGWPSFSDAATLQEDYALLQRERMDLDAARRQVEDDLNGVAKELAEVSRKFSSCNRARVQVDWEANRNQVEDGRRTLEKENRELETKRRDVEQTRKSLERRRLKIESSHTNKTPGSAYEAAFREYMSALQSNYFPVVRGLLDGYVAYFDGARGYIEFLNKFADDCSGSERSSRQVIQDATKSALDRIAKAANKIRSFLS